MQETINSFDQAVFQTRNRGKVNIRGIKMTGKTTHL
jgi:hypothetical protein